MATSAAPARAQGIVPPPPAPPPAPVTAATAAAESAAGDKAAKAKDWTEALAHYQSVQQAAPTAHAQLGVADALYQLNRAGEAYDAYAEAQKTSAAKLSGAEKALVAARLKELASKTGALSIHVEESGSDVLLDGKSIGASPMAALVRVGVGAHEVRVTRAGFVPFVGAADVQADGKATVDASPLVAQASTGHVIVHAAGTTEPLRVIVDGVDLGATPWEGDLPSGSHQFTGRSCSATASAQNINVAVGATQTVDLVSAATAAHLNLQTSDGKGTVYVDGVAKGEGTFQGDVTPGAHVVVVQRDGYERYEKTLNLGERETWAETVTLKEAAAAASTAGVARAFEGLYGGFGLLPLFGIGGEGTDIDTSCNALGALSCDTGNAVGGGIFGYVGWTFDPVGFEVMLAASADTDSEAAHFSTTGGNNATSPLAYPSRDEKFTFARAGGLAAVRVRATFDNRYVRGTIAGGVGLSYRKLFMKRDSATTDGTNRADVYSPTTDEGVSYVSPAITVEAAAQIRVTPTVAFSVGLEMIADHAPTGSTEVPAPTSPRYLGAVGQTPVAIATPAYHLATGPQVFLGPFLGMAFGP
ncbi:MAG TPA: PEGA domain-containing protein [Polyangiaceae bacterium]|nr:PEGA domain-containing protein [Polyangiaceae bacterium]